MKTLVLVHGHGVDADIWKKLKVFLHDFDVLTPDFSTQTAFKTIEEYADGLFHWLEHQKIEKCTLVGHSMGGYMALAFAEKYPQMLEGFGLFHSTAFADDEPKREQREKTLRFIETYSAAAFIRQSGPNMYAEAFANQYPETIKNHLEKYTQLPTEAVITGFKAIMNRPDRVAVLQKATVPVLLIFGKEDKFIPFEKHIGLSEIPQQAHTFVSSKSGHLGMIEDAEGCAGAIRDFMKNL